MRLIDADLLEKQMNKEVLHLFNSMHIFNSMHEGYVKAMKCVKQQPTVFDVDKVVEQLETKKTRATELKKKYISEYFDGEAGAFEFAIKIVKGGGVE